MPAYAGVRDDELGLEFARFCDGELAEPYGFTAQLRDLDPVHWSKRLDAWVLTRYSDVLAGLSGAPFFNDRISAYMAALSPKTSGNTLRSGSTSRAGWASRTPRSTCIYVR